YSLRVPHQAVMLGESRSAQAVPLGAVGETAYHTGITVNGDPAGILPPATSGFELDQLLRASAVRIDLGIDGEQVDSDGDGMPDWWEDQHGLDKQDGSDALTDLNGDGTSNLDAYLAGVDPQRDVTEPLLLTSEITVYANATSLVPLEVEDVDSSPDQLTFMVYSLPVGGELRLRNAQVLPGSTDQVVQVGDTFTLADVRSGRLVLSHPGSESVGPFEVGVRDEDPSHEESRGEVAVRMFESSPESLAVTSSEKVRFQTHQLVTDLDHLVVDFGGRPGKHFQSSPTSGLSQVEYESHMESFGPAQPHVLLGGPADDVLTGGAANDFLLGDQGGDRMTGGFGADSFLFISESDDVDSISDFRPDEGDVIDVAALLEGTSELLTDYVRIRRSGEDALLEVDADGVGADFSDLTVRLEDSSLEAGDVENLYYGGNLEAGSVVLPPRISVALGASASENGPTAGHFILFREGALDGDVTVAIQLSGNATNGADYELIHGTVLMPDGASSFNVPVSPYVDPTVEFNEVVHLSLVSSADYLIGADSSAQMMIEDLKPQMSLEVLEPLASVDEGAAAAVLMRREGLVSSEVFVQFDLEGTAVNGTDYDYISPFVSFGAGQTTKLVMFNPRSNVDFSGVEAKTIRMSLKPDVAYAMPV
ncbi:MAG: Calx-beta domain-containing protein, partial [Haloferula sp.]